MSKSKVTLCRKKFLFSGPSPVSGNPIEATTGRQGQKPGHPARGSEPTSPEALPPTAWTSATSCLRQEPHLSQTMSPAIGEPHTHLRSLLPDSILTKWEEPLPPPYRLPATSVALPNFHGAHQGKLQPQTPRVHPESSAWTPVLPWTSPPMGHTYTSKAEPVPFLPRVTPPSVTAPALGAGRPELLLPLLIPAISLQTL